MKTTHQDVSEPFEDAAFIPRTQEERPEGKPEDTLETKTQPYTARQGSPEDTLNIDHIQQSRRIRAIMDKPEDALYNNNLKKPLRNVLQFHNTQVCVVTRDNRNSIQHGTPLSFEKIDSDSRMDQPFPNKLETNTSQQ